MTRLSLILLFAICALAKGGEFKLAFHAIDDEGNSIENADIGLATEVGPFVPLEQGKEVHKKSDKNGYVEFVGRTDLPSFYYGGSKPGYYPVYQIKTHFLGKSLFSWQPWGGVLNVVLKRVRNPVPLYVLRFRTMRDFHKPVGYDLRCGDWVQPFGSGEVPDIIFSSDGYVEKPTVYHGSVKLTFPGAGNGILAVPRDNSSSLLRMPYEAPGDGYQSEINLNRDSVSDLIPRSDHDRMEFENRGGDYFFRVRAEEDADGRVTRALYGKIRFFTESCGIADKDSIGKVGGWETSGTRVLRGTTRHC